MSQDNRLDPRIVGVWLTIAALIYVGVLLITMLTGHWHFSDVALPLGGILLCLYLWIIIRRAGRQ